MMMQGGTEAGRRASPAEGSNRARVPPDLKGANDHPANAPSGFGQLGRFALRLALEAAVYPR